MTAQSWIKNFKIVLRYIEIKLRKHIDIDISTAIFNVLRLQFNFE